MTIAYALLTIFTVTEPPDILQSDNAGEFWNIACNSKTTHFSEDELNTIISYFINFGLVQNKWQGLLIILKAMVE